MPLDHGAILYQVSRAPDSNQEAILMRDRGAPAHPGKLSTSKTYLTLQSDAEGIVELPRQQGTTISKSRVYRFRHPAMIQRLVRRDGVEPPQSETPGLRPGGLASAQPTHEQCSMSSPGVEPGLRPSQGRVRIPHTPRTVADRSRSPARESNPAWRLRTPPCFRHTREDSCLEPVMPSPGVEPGLRPSEGRVRSVTLQGQNG